MITGAGTKSIKDNVLVVYIIGISLLINWFIWKN